MKRVVITGGKGGCGKTSVAVSMAALADNWVIADCDVDAPNLAIIAQPEHSKHEVFNTQGVKIDPDICTRCGICREKCKFDAISEDYHIDLLKCETCGLCVELCPVDAITYFQTEAGFWESAKSRFGPFYHARLNPGAENSGKLVTLIRQKAEEHAEKYGMNGVIIDGPPGVGCPVIASITGCDYAIAVTEPTLSGKHDLERLCELTAILRTPVGVVINKATLSRKNEISIRKYAESKGLEIIGELPYDRIVTEAQMARKAVVEYSPDSEFAMALRNIWEKVNSKL